MNRIIGIVSILVFGFGLSTQNLFAQPRQHYSMDVNWQFTLGDPNGAQNPGFDDSGWRTLNVPHDWSIEGAFDKNAPGGGSIGYLPTGIGWYRKQFTLPKDVDGKKVWIEFDGIYMNSDVWLNGHHLGHRPYGYISFSYDLTPYLQHGENIIAVRVDNSQQPNSRWYTGSGIYRHVRLVISNPIHIDHWGVDVTTPVANIDSGIVRIKIKVVNGNEKSDVGLTIESILIDHAGKEIARTTKQIDFKKDSQITSDQQLMVKKPKLWSLDSPYLYSLKSTVRQNGKIIDQVFTPVGIRSFRYDTDRGFFLNGEHVKMHGVNLHHAGGQVGAAVPIGVWEYRLKKLKAMGVNAIRTAHNPPAPEFLDLCDQLGLLVMDEAFDEWKGGKRPYSYHIYFNDWYKRDLTDMILRDRNHPSIVLWSAGNEIGEQTTASGVGILEQLMGIFHELDPSRPVTTGNDHIADNTAPTTKEFLNALDIVGYNYADRWGKRRELVYTPDKIAYPDWKMIGTESPNIYWIRDNYSLGSDPKTVRSNYNSNMIRVEQLWKFVSMHDYVIGDFMWTGIDYLGESWWPAKNAASGCLDLAGFEKDSYYFYQSQWTDKPVLHLFPHWNWSGREGQVIPVLAYTNCDTVELFLNGKSYGRKMLAFPRQGTSGGWNSYAEPRVLPTTADLHLSWDVPYEPGVLKAVGRKNGKVVITREIRTTGPPAKIHLSVNKPNLNADGSDVAQLVVEIQDQAGNNVPVADNLVKFNIRGAGRIIGVGNGNPLDHDSHKAEQRKAFLGKCLAIIQSTRTQGKITIDASAEGLEGASVTLNTEEVNNMTPVLK